MNSKIIFFILIVLVIILAVVHFFVRDNSASVPLSDVSDPASTHQISLSNISEEYVISHGVLVVHDGTTSLDYLGVSAPSVFEPLAEIGDPAALMQWLRNNPAVHEVVRVEIIEPGQQQSITVSDAPADAQVSYMGMIVQTNDGVVLVNSIPLTLADEGEFEGSFIFADVFDMGTEENTPIGSGFEGGQPDPTRGEENINNGTPTVGGEVTLHPQFHGDDAVSNGILTFSFL